MVYTASCGVCGKTCTSVVSQAQANYNANAHTARGRCGPGPDRRVSITDAVVEAVHERFPSTARPWTVDMFDRAARGDVLLLIATKLHRYDARRPPPE